MAKKVFFKLMVVITGLFLHFSLSAQTSLTLNVATAGTLYNLINSTQMSKTTDLTLTGNLDGTDISCIISMTNTFKLSSLNLQGANIVSGGYYYYYDQLNFV